MWVVSGSLPPDSGGRGFGSVISTNIDNKDITDWPAFLMARFYWWHFLNEYRPALNSEGYSKLWGLVEMWHLATLSLWKVTVFHLLLKLSFPHWYYLSIQQWMTAYYLQILMLRSKDWWSGASRDLQWIQMHDFEQKVGVRPCCLIYMTFLCYWSVLYYIQTW